MAFELAVVSVAHGTGSPDATPNGNMIINRNDEAVIGEYLAQGYALAGVVPVASPQAGVRLYFTRQKAESV